jgi:hypothetical protein
MGLVVIGTTSDATADVMRRKMVTEIMRRVLVDLLILIDVTIAVVVTMTSTTFLSTIVAATTATAATTAARRWVVPMLATWMF